MKNTHLTHPSLLPLREALIAAGSEVPSRPVSRMDVHEQRALQLIARMQAEYKKIAPFIDRQDVSNSRALDVSVSTLAVMHS